MQFQGYGNQGYWNPYCQICGGDHSSLYCQARNQFTPINSYEDYSWQQNCSPNTYDSEWLAQQENYWYGTSTVQKVQHISPLDEAMARMQEAHAEFFAWREECHQQDHKMSPLEEAMARMQKETAEFCAWSKQSRQEMNTLCTNVPSQLDQMERSLFQGPQVDLQIYNDDSEPLEEHAQFQEPLMEEYEDKFQTKSIHQEPQILDHSMEREFEDCQEEILTNQPCVDLANSGDIEIKVTYHEVVPSKEADSQSLKPQVGFPHSQDVHIAFKEVVETKSTPKEGKQSIFVPYIDPFIINTMPLLLETYILEDVKSIIRKIQACAQKLFLKLVKYHRDDIIYIYDPG